MLLIDEYFILLENYKMKHGDNTFLFMQVGSFYEVYSKTMEDVHMLKFSSLCDLKIANKPLGKVNMYMAGFRDYVLDKYIERVVSNSDYTVVVYDQYEKCGVIDRKESGIYSRGMFFNTSDISPSNNITCLWIHKTSKKFNEKYIFGISNIDIYTGYISTDEYNIPYYHNPTSYDDIEKHMSIYNPVEIVIIYSMEETLIDTIIKYINHNSKKTTKINLNDIHNPFTEQAKRCENQVYQEEIINCYYPHLENETMKSNLFEKMISFHSLCFLLNFVNQHNPDLTKKISEPIINNNNNKLTLANQTLKQLNIIDNEQSKNNTYSSILSLLNKCKTTIGKREFQRIITNPIKNINELNKSYDITQHMIEKNYDWSIDLQQIKDIEKILRKNILCKINPIDYYYLYENCNNINHILDTITSDIFLCEYIKKNVVLDTIEIIKNTIEGFFNIEVLSQINNIHFDKFPDVIEGLINRNNDEKLDSFIENKLESKDKLNKIVDYLNEIYLSVDKKVKTSVIKIHETSNEILLLITKRRGQILKSHLKGIIKLEYLSSYTNQMKHFHFDTDLIEYNNYNTTTFSLQGFDINNVTKKVSEDTILFYNYLLQVYNSFHSKINYDDVIVLIETIKILDVIHTKKNIALQYNYSKPIIEHKEKSFFNAVKLRHPLIENIEENELFVTNDISLGDETNGILLYGTNAVGKTSLIKSIGICVIMAQCGLFVPCEKFVYSPYEYIFTRIIGNDNIFKGLSTFAVEMSELRIILKYCNSNSLILGDELCSGTEIDSALSIFVSGLETMYHKNSSFIFATHFHQIQYFDEIKKMERIVLKHLTVYYNHELDTLVYDRKLKDGAGDSIYGLEVCKSLNLPVEFLERAYTIRNKYDSSYNNVLTFKTSKYNKDKLKSFCEFCNINLADEIHHLTYQKDMKGNINMNHKSNLSSVCEKCHDYIHKLGLVYERKKTLKGFQIILKKKD